MCEHERLRTVGDDVFCCNCGEHLPLEFLMNKGKPAKPAKAPEKKPEEIPAAAEEAKPAKKKAPAKKTTKKTEGN